MLSAPQPDWTLHWYTVGVGPCGSRGLTLGTTGTSGETNFIELLLSKFPNNADLKAAILKVGANHPLIETAQEADDNRPRGGFEKEAWPHQLVVRVRRLDASPIPVSCKTEFVLGPRSYVFPWPLPIEDQRLKQILDTRTSGIDVPSLKIGTVAGDESDPNRDIYTTAVMVTADALLKTESGRKALCGLLKEQDPERRRALVLGLIAETAPKLPQGFTAIAPPNRTKFEGHTLDVRLDPNRKRNQTAVEGYPKHLCLVLGLKPNDDDIGFFKCDAAGAQPFTFQGLNKLKAASLIADVAATVGDEVKAADVSAAPYPDFPCRP